LNAVKLWTRRILKGLGVAIIAAVIAGSAYEQVGRSEMMALELAQ
jgi:hypothetical protein